MCVLCSRTFLLCDTVRQKIMFRYCSNRNKASLNQPVAPIRTERTEVCLCVRVKTSTFIVVYHHSPQLRFQTVMGETFTKHYVFTTKFSIQIQTPESGRFSNFFLLCSAPGQYSNTTTFSSLSLVFIQISPILITHPSAPYFTRTQRAPRIQSRARNSLVVQVHYFGR